MARNLVEDNWRLMSSTELPPCDGPKLQAFKHRSARIHWGDCISGIGGEGEDIGSQAYVFKVEIKSRTYALKVVRKRHLDMWSLWYLRLTHVVVQVLQTLNTEVRTRSYSGKISRR